MLPPEKDCGSLPGKLILRFRYFLTSPHESVVVLGSRQDSRAGASSSLLNKRMCMKEIKEKMAIPRKKRQRLTVADVDAMERRISKPNL